MNNMLIKVQIKYFFILYYFAFIPITIILIDLINSKNTQTSNFITEINKYANIHIFIIIWICFILKKYKVDFKELTGKIYPVYNHIKYIWLVPFVLIITMISSILILTLLFLKKPIFFQTIISSVSHPFNFPYLDFILTVLIIPCVEEIFFRGFLLQKFIIKFGITKAIFYSSLIFLLFHITKGNIGSFIFSLVLSVIFLKTRMLFANIFFHIVYNFSCDQIFASWFFNLLVSIASLIGIPTNQISSKLDTIVQNSSKLTDSETIDIINSIFTHNFVAILILSTIVLTLIVILFLYKNWPKYNVQKNHLENKALDFEEI